MVSFRLTEDQYEEFRSLCASHGSSSVSDMARTAVTLLLGRPKPSPQQMLESRVADVEERISALAADIRRLQNTVSSPQSSAAAAPVMHEKLTHAEQS